MTIRYPVSYQDENDALRQMIALSGRAEADLAVHLFPAMKRRAAHTRLLNCLNPHRRNVLTFGKVIEAMLFCARFDPLMYVFDQLEMPRPDRLGTDLGAVLITESIESASNTLNSALKALDKLQAKACDTANLRTVG